MLQNYTEVRVGKSYQASKLEHARTGCDLRRIKPNYHHEEVR